MICAVYGVGNRKPKPPGPRRARPDDDLWCFPAKRASGETTINQRRTARDFPEHRLKAVPYRIHPILTDNGIQFAEQPRNRNTAWSRHLRPRQHPRSRWTRRLHGPHLPKILFETHIFTRHTKPDRFNGSHPRLSSASWNRSLYVGGERGWERLYEAMQLDRTAALMSGSVGRYQIMGFNHQRAGFATVEAYWDAMKESERRHLEAFVAFIENSRLTAALRQISNVHADCIPFARGYNGAGLRSEPVSREAGSGAQQVARLMNWTELLRGANGGIELNRAVGALGGLSYIIGAHVFIAWNMIDGRPFDLAAAVAIKNRNVATAKVIEETGHTPARGGHDAARR